MKRTRVGADVLLPMLIAIRWVRSACPLRESLPAALLLVLRWCPPLSKVAVAKVLDVLRVRPMNTVTMPPPAVAWVVIESVRHAWQNTAAGDEE